MKWYYLSGVEHYLLLNPIGYLIGLFDEFWRWKDMVEFGKHFTKNGFGPLTLELCDTWIETIQANEP